MKELQEVLAKTVKELFGVEVEPILTRPEEQFGDYSTNVAMQLARKLNKNPTEIAETINSKLAGNTMIAKTEVANPGFINIWLTDMALMQGLKHQPDEHIGQTVVVEYSDPNPFKILHVGHLYTSVVGDAIANLYENSGAKVARVNFGGDVGLHVAKTLWAVLQKLGGEEPEKLKTVPDNQRPQWLSEAYVAGNNAYEDNQSAKEPINDLNKRIYQLVEKGDKQSPLAQIYWTTRQWSYDYFEEFYKKIGTKFDKYYPESETVEPGMKTVKENLGKVFEESQGAVVFKGEVHNLHTRVFINSEGLPTYETKDIGLIQRKWQDYHFDRSIVITGNEQAEYMAVVLAAIAQIQPELAQKTTHITHGLVKLGGGQKMSSREGNIIRAEDVLEQVNQSNKQINGEDNANVALGAIKYAFLKHRIGADIIFDPAESVGLQGNSGPYLQYAYVRAKSILSKAGFKEAASPDDLEAGERRLARKLSEFPEAVARATAEAMPHHICTYLYELAQTFNKFYEENRVIGDAREATRLKLVEHYSQTLKSGLELLGIPVLEKM